MGIKSTQHIKREEAISILLSNTPFLNDEDLALLLTSLGDLDSNIDLRATRFDNFIIKEEE